MKKILIVSFLIGIFILFLPGQNAMAYTQTTVSSLMEVLNEEKQESVYNTQLNAPFSKESSGIKETINPETGEIILNHQIFYIPSRNGQDLSLNLQYRSRDAKLFTEGTKIGRAHV